MGDLVRVETDPCEGDVVALEAQRHIARIMGEHRIEEGEVLVAWRQSSHGSSVGRRDVATMACSSVVGAVECMAFGPSGAAQSLAHSSSGPCLVLSHRHIARNHERPERRRPVRWSPLLPCRRAGGARASPRRSCWRPAGRGRLLPSRYGRAVAGATPGSTSNARMNRLRESASPVSIALSPRAMAARCARSELI